MSPVRETILKRINEEKIDRIWLWFTDILGQLKGVELAPQEVEGALADGMGFDGSSIEGFARIEESDLMALPDPRSFSVFRDLETGEAHSAQVFCDLYTPDMKPYAGDPRQVLRRHVDRLAKHNRTMQVGPEMEFFYTKGPQTLEGFDRTGYFDASMTNEGTELRKKTVASLEAMGVRCEYSHHEVAPSQHEIDIRHLPALQMADVVMSVRYLVKEVATAHSAYATFMPKPIYGVNGSGMHTHQSIFEGDRNLFFDPDHAYHLSSFAQKYVAGILRHIREITAVLNQWVNSYKRLVLGYEAPVYVSWGQKNRSALVRVPRYRVGKERASRVELRSPDAVCNPYLAFSVMLAAGLKGVEQDYELPDPVEADLFRMGEAERGRLGIETLPGDLYEAVLEMEKSELVRECLGDHIVDKFIENKKIEWERYRAQVTDFEVENYLPVL
jgi:glutamine synthetase